ncbi:MAG: hypothetical protein ACRENE_01530 [Polyangiaceae bacterium]
MNRAFVVVAIVAAFGEVACASQWKIQGGPKECIKMCSNWDLEFAGMVGVGNQDATGDGATACVCQVRGKATGSAGAAEGAAAGSIAAPITAAEAAAAAQAAQQQRMQMYTQMSAPH